MPGEGNRNNMTDNVLVIRSEMSNMKLIFCYLVRSLVERIHFGQNAHVGTGLLIN